MSPASALGTGRVASLSAAPPAEVEVVSQWEEFLAMEEEWSHLHERSLQRDNPFLAHEWLRAWWEAFGGRTEMLVLRLLAGERLIGIAPLMRGSSTYYGLPVRLLSLITNNHTNRADLIVAEQPGRCVAALLSFIHARARSWDMAQLNFVPADSPTAAAAEQAPAFSLACAVQPSHDSPVIPLDGNWESFYGRLDGHFRRNLRNREKRLERLGPVEYEELHDGPLHPFLQEIFAVGDRSWKAQGKTAVASTPALCRFYARLAELTQPKGRLSLHLLRVGGKPIAFHYSLRNDGAIYLLKTEYDTEYHPYSPGHQIQRHVLESAYRRGLRAFEFLGPDMPWKREWADRVRRHVKLLFFHQGPCSRLLRFLELRAKPALKRSPIVRRLRGQETPCH